jgi:hypothetical protein
MSAKRMAELVDALVSNCCGNRCQFVGSGYLKPASFGGLMQNLFCGGIPKSICQFSDL